MELFLVRHHRKEKRFGPSPANDYTSGYGRRGLFGRGRGRKNARDVDSGDPDVLPEHTYPSNVNNGYPTGTAVGQDQPSNTYNKHGESGYAYQQSGRTNGYSQQQPGRINGYAQQQPGRTNGTTAAPGTGNRYGNGVFNA